MSYILDALRRADAEREVGRHAARLSALNEAQARLSANRDEITAAMREAERALQLQSDGDLELGRCAVGGQRDRRQVVAEAAVPGVHGNL